MTEERRYIPTELRVVADGDESPRIEGYAAVFDSLSQELFGFREKIAPGAFADSIARPDDIKAMFNHDPNVVLGRNVAGTLELREDNHGLWFGCDLPDTQAARDLAVSLRRGDISQCSFGFVTHEEQWQLNDDGPDIRTLLRVDLFDVSPVTHPAYTDTAVALRSRDDWKVEHAPVMVDFTIARARLDLKAKL